MNGNRIGAQINKAKMRLQQTGQQFLSNTQRYQQSLPKEGNGLLYVLIGILFILLGLVLVLTIYYIITDCPEKKTFTDYLWNPTSPCTARSNTKGTVDFELPTVRQVFHIANQDYTFDQAKCKCQAYGARLATKEDMIEAYNKGADWCTYGWSAGQNAYYPTQPKTWNRLQLDPRKKDDCGRPGVNGGFFANPVVKFGINCYGIKPAGRVVLEKPHGKLPFCMRNNNFQASHKLETDQIAPFNKTRWNE